MQSTIYDGATVVVAVVVVRNESSPFNRKSMLVIETAGYSIVSHFHLALTALLHGLLSFGALAACAFHSLKSSQSNVTRCAINFFGRHQ